MKTKYRHTFEMKLPCKDCISLALCAAKVIKEHKVYSLSPIRRECSLIRDYVGNYENKNDFEHYIVDTSKLATMYEFYRDLS